MNIPNWFVVVMGMGVTFVGLACLIGLTYLMSLICRRGERPVGTAAGTPSEEIPNRGEVVAAVAAVIAEDLGTDVTAIRILSFKKVEQ